MTKARDIASAAPAPSTVSATELGYLDGVTSAIQTQVDAKTAKSTLTTTGDIYYASAANTPARLGIGSTGNVLTVASGIPSWAAPASGMTLVQRSTFTNVAGTGTTFDGVFTSTYKSYQVMIERIGVPVAASAEIRMVMRDAGADATTSYNGNTNFGSHNSNTVSGSNTAESSFFMLLPGAGGADDNEMSAGTLFFYKVATGSSVQAIWTGLAFATYNNKNHFIGAKMTVGRNANGFRLYSTGGNITGTIAIYGLAA
jgi:hypothetical protein